MYRAEVVGTKAALVLGEKGLQAARHHLHRPFEPDPLRRRSQEPEPAHSAHGSADRRVEGDRAEDQRRGPPRRAGQSDLQRSRPGALQPPAALLHPARGLLDPRGRPDRRRGRSPGSRERPSHPPGGLAARPGGAATSMAADRRRGIGTRLAGGPGRVARDLGSGRVHGPPRGRSGGHRRPRRVRAAVLPRSPGPQRSGSDGAGPAGSRVASGRHPGDDRGWGQRPAGAAERP